MTAVPTPSPTPTRSAGKDCGPKVEVRLPVIGEAPPRRPVAKSKVGKWRAIVLIGLHLAFVAHITYWLTGKNGVRPTITPVEPSESMSTLELGAVNAGFVFFAVALFSTLIFGRFFCGWGCHIVALQDLCGWMMKKLGIHPKPFRSRLLLWAPLLLALYMFVWPTFRREVLVPLIGADIDRDGIKTTLVTGLRESLFQQDLNHDGHIAKPGEPGDFVPGVPEAVIGRDLNGNGRSTDVLSEYEEFPLWLGRVAPLPKFQKHFITDDFWATFASWPVAIPFLLICGFGAVYFLGAKAYCFYGCPYGGFFAPLDRLSPFRIRVNDNCNQCGHCTAVCTSNVRVHEEVHNFGAVVDPGCMKCLDCISVCPTDALRVGIGAPGLLIKPRNPDSPDLARAKEHAQRRYDLSLREEIIVGLLFFAMFYGYRGMYGLVPLLMAMGIAMVVAFMLFKSWRVLRDANVRAPFWQLKRDGRIRLAGWAFLLATAAFSVVGVQGIAIKTAYARGDALAAHLQRTDESWASVRKQYTPTTADRADARDAINSITFAAGLRDGGVAFITTPAVHERLSFLYAYTGDNAKAERHLLQLMLVKEPGPQWTGALMGFLQVRSAPLDERQKIVESLVARWPENDTVRLLLAQHLVEGGKPDQAVELYRKRLEQAPLDEAAINSAAVLRLHLNPPRIDEAAELIKQGLTKLPDSALLHEGLAQVYLAHNDLPQAATALRTASENQPTPQRWNFLAQIYQAMGQPREADAAAARAQELLNPSGSGSRPGQTTAPLEATPSATR
ncbi:MAG: tetratricopeptide repeat protein [Phycisphaerales bacterium]